jgi:hypothetical protein
VVFVTLNSDALPSESMMMMPMIPMMPVMPMMMPMGFCDTGQSSGQHRNQKAGRQNFL